MKRYKRGTVDVDPVHCDRRAVAGDSGICARTGGQADVCHLHGSFAERGEAMKQRLLLTRGTNWLKVRDWRVLLMAPEPHLLTCRKQAQLSGCLTSIEAANVTLRRFPDAELFMWDEPNYIPGRSLTEHKAVRVVGAFEYRRLGA